MRSSGWSISWTRSKHKAATRTESVGQCKQEAATILVSLATAWHREAIGTDPQPGTNDRSTMGLATSALSHDARASSPTWRTMQFPDIDRRDWPTQYKVSYYYAELLWKMENWGECGPAFDHVVELNPAGGVHGRRRVRRRALLQQPLPAAVPASRARDVAASVAGHETPRQTQTRPTTRGGACRERARSARVHRSRTGHAARLPALRLLHPRRDRPADDQVPSCAHLLRGEPLRRGGAALQGHRVEQPRQRARGVRGEPLPRFAQRARKPDDASARRVHPRHRRRDRAALRVLLRHAGEHRRARGAL